MSDFEHCNCNTGEWQGQLCDRCNGTGQAAKQSMQGECLATIETYWSPDAGWQYNLKLNKQFDSDKFCEEFESKGKVNLYTHAPDSAARIAEQAADNARLKAENETLYTTMMAAAVEIQEHWDAHCDDEGYGPANLMHRLESGIAARYGYDAKTVVNMEAEIARLQKELEEARKQLKYCADDYAYIPTQILDCTAGLTDWIRGRSEVIQNAIRQIGGA